jgi:endonuclease NucS-like protein
VGNQQRFWKVNCMEDKYPGLWHTWFSEQVVAVGWWPPRWSLESQSKYERAAWNLARHCLKKMTSGDRIAVQLKDWRIGRIGTILRLRIRDEEWTPTVPSQNGDKGEMGRRIEVRWDLAKGPLTPDSAIQLPVEARPNVRIWRPTLSEMSKQAFELIEKAAEDEFNWAPILRGFAKETAMSDFISVSPHLLEDGLRLYPYSKAREHVFHDGRRSDVLLLDRDGNIVIVECKQDAPAICDIQQLRIYMRNAEKLKTRVKVGRKIRGILVHGGARKLKDDVRREVAKSPKVEMVTFTVNVGFATSS